MKRILLGALQITMVSNVYPMQIVDSPLHEAVAEGSLATVKELLSLGARVNIGGFDYRGDCCKNTPLHLAVRRNDANIVKELIAAGAKNYLDSDEKLPLDYAIKNDNRDIVAMLLTDKENFENVLYAGYLGGNIDKERLRCFVQMLPLKFYKNYFDKHPVDMNLP